MTVFNGQPPRLLLYAAGLMAAAVSLGAILYWSGEGFGNPSTVIALALVAAIAERGSVHLSATTEQSISLLPTLFAAVLFGPLAAGAVGAASMIGDPELYRTPQPGRAPLLKWATYTSSRFMVGAAIGGVAYAAMAIVPNRFGGIVLATLVGAVVGEILDVLFAAVTARMRGRRMSDIARTVAPLLIASAPVYAPIVAILTIAYEQISPWTAPLFFAPALAAQRLFTLYQEQRRLAEHLVQANDDLEFANLSFASALVATLDARDRYTAGHSAAVAAYSRDIAARMGLSPLLQERVHMCGLVHDIGKIGLPAGLLEKAGPLNLEERRQMQSHPEIGERILANVPDYADVATIVRHHHERVDGLGYPDGVSGDDIPILARIIAVADAYDAMTSDRPYREAMPSRVARLRLAQAVESQFDTSVVAAFEAILAGADANYRSGSTARTAFTPAPEAITHPARVA